MRAIVDADLCIGCEACVDICPEVFAMAGDLAVAKSGEVSADLEALTRDAASACPVDAIVCQE